tara:strand:+ start:281 stop:490 length:210 start_codon:yes stop_codon:yes gene_type:complete
VEKNKKKYINMNWINSWKAANKKEKYEINIRIGTLTLLEIMFCPCEMCESKKTHCPRFRFMIFNLGFEV